VSDTERAAWRKAPEDKHLSPEDLAEREGVPLMTVYGWNKTRTGPRYMKIGRHVRYHRRRRAASWRLPVLYPTEAQIRSSTSDFTSTAGHRDPLDTVARLPVRRPAQCCGAELGPDGQWRACCRGVA
jgi:hypothetical protein